MELRFEKYLWNLNSKQYFHFLTFAKVDQNICIGTKIMPVLVGRLVLHWINSTETRHKSSVANRLTKRSENIEPEQRRHIPFLLNSAVEGLLVSPFRMILYFPIGYMNCSIMACTTTTILNESVTILWSSSKKSTNLWFAGLKSIF